MKTSKILKHLKFEVNLNFKLKKRQVQLQKIAAVFKQLAAIFSAAK